MRIPLKKKRSRYQKARDALRDMLPKKHPRGRRKPTHPAATEHDIPEHKQGFAELHWMTAGLFVAAGAEAALSRGRRPGRAGRVHVLGNRH